MSWTILTIITILVLMALSAVAKPNIKTIRAVYRAFGWGRTQSTAVCFEAVDGIIEHPRRVVRYQAQLNSQTARK